MSSILTALVTCLIEWLSKVSVKCLEVPDPFCTPTSSCKKRCSLIMNSRVNWMQIKSNIVGLLVYWHQTSDSHMLKSCVVNFLQCFYGHCLFWHTTRCQNSCCSFTIQSKLSNYQVSVMYHLRSFYRAAMYAMRSFRWASVRPSVRPSVCLSNVWIVTKRKHLAKKFNYD